MKRMIFSLLVCGVPALAQDPAGRTAPMIAVPAGAALPARIVVPPAGTAVASAAQVTAVPLFLPAPVAAAAAGSGGDSLLGLGGVAAAVAGIAAASLLSGSTTSTTATR